MYACKKFFDEFTEFVAMHYALSHRNDTKYWKDISNKSFYDKRLNDNSIKADILAKMNNHTFINSLSGHHCIGVGLRYFGVDILKDKASEENNFTLDLRNKEVNKWNIQCKFKPKLIQFLKDNIHF